MGLGGGRRGERLRSKRVGLGEGGRRGESESERYRRETRRGRQGEGDKERETRRGRQGEEDKERERRRERQGEGYEGKGEERALHAEVRHLFNICLLNKDGVASRSGNCLPWSWRRRNRGRFCAHVFLQKLRPGE